MQAWWLFVEDLCGPRTGGWLLPGVMSDWQCGVDWFLPKYCRCRLRLDWCWCKWRISVKGRGRWGLHVWRRQVRLVQVTRWPAESSAGGKMKSWTVLSSASKPRSSQDFVGVESWVVIGGGYTEFTGFPVVHQKTTGFLGWSAKPRPKTGRSSSRPDWSVGTGLTGVRRRSPETSKQRTRVGIARLASRLSKFAVVGHPSDGAMTKCPSMACILVLSLRGSFFFQLPPYNPSGESMAVISRNPSSFCFAIFLFHFLLEFLGLTWKLHCEIL
jgi:hypothetical protein